jgi:hypothetical protein
MKAGLVKIRFIGQNCFIEQNMESSIGNIIFYKSFIKKWDGQAKGFCEFRNKVCHEYKFLESLKEKKEERVSKYLILYEKLRNVLKPLENMLKHDPRLDMLKNSRLLSADQVKKKKD